MRALLNSLSLSLVLLAAAALSGCAVGWRSEIDPAAARYEQVAAGKLPEKKNLRLTVDVQDFRSMSPDQVIRLSQKWEDYGQKYLGASGVFASVSTARADADMELRLHVREIPHLHAILMPLNLLTLGIIPAPVRVEIEAEGEVYTPQGKHEGIKIRGARSHIMSWLMLPLQPTSSIAARRYRRDVFRSAIVQMIEMPEIWSGEPPAAPAGESPAAAAPETQPTQASPAP